MSHTRLHLIYDIAINLTAVYLYVHLRYLRGQVNNWYQLWLHASGERAKTDTALLRAQDEIQQLRNREIPF